MGWPRPLGVSKGKALVPVKGYANSAPFVDELNRPLSEPFPRLEGFLAGRGSRGRCPETRPPHHDAQEESEGPPRTQDDQGIKTLLILGFGSDHQITHAPPTCVRLSWSQNGIRMGIHNHTQALSTPQNFVFYQHLRNAYARILFGMLRAILKPSLNLQCGFLCKRSGSLVQMCMSKIIDKQCLAPSLHLPVFQKFDNSMKGEPRVQNKALPVALDLWKLFEVIDKTRGMERRQSLINQSLSVIQRACLQKHVHR